MVGSNGFAASKTTSSTAKLIVNTSKTNSTFTVSQSYLKTTTMLWRWSWTKRAQMKEIMMTLPSCRFTKRPLIYMASFMQDTSLPQRVFKQWSKNISRKTLDDVQECFAMDSLCCLLAWQISFENQESRFFVHSVRMSTMLRRNARILMGHILDPHFLICFCRLFQTRIHNTRRCIMLHE